MIDVAVGALNGAKASRSMGYKCGFQSRLVYIACHKGKEL